MVWGWFGPPTPLLLLLAPWAGPTTSLLQLLTPRAGPRKPRPGLLNPLLLLVTALATIMAEGEVEVLPNNCFSFLSSPVDGWDELLEWNQSVASLSLVLPQSTPSPVLGCLRREAAAVYQVAVMGDLESAQFLSPSDHQWVGRASSLVDSPPRFPYLIYAGRYRLRVTYCGLRDCRDSSLHETVFSHFISVQSSVKPGCAETGAVEGSNQTGLRQRDTQVEDMKAVFHFSFVPCSLHSYDTANLSLYSSDSAASCGTQIIFEETVPVSLEPSSGEALIHYSSPSLRGDRYYCVSLTLGHVSCRLANLRLEELCVLRVSEPVWVPALPFISRLLPFCSSHFACAWLYVSVGGTLALLLSLSLALILVRCCRRKDTLVKDRGDEVDFGGSAGELAEISQERVTWGSLHKEWEATDQKPRGKILLLYSPDTKLFRELQEALKSFLDLACHCDIYDLFDDALFDTIALDPSEWLQEFVNDKDVKIVVISSIGAYHRQLAFNGSMPLNLPDGLSDNILDGLFTSGLRFISSYPGLAASGRVATARYEMLHLTAENYRLAPPLCPPSLREFLVPTQLHELFCWVHQLQPLDVIGKPWANYHLEMQLLQDALKLARRDRGVMSTYNSIGNAGQGTSL